MPQDSSHSALSPAVGSPSKVAGMEALSELQMKLKPMLDQKATSPTDDDESPNVEQKLFLVVSVALATVCFFTNAVQVGVFLRPSFLRSVKNVLLLSQAFSGLLASFIVIFPIHSIAMKGSPSGVGGFNACYFGHSSVILISMITSLSTATLLLLHHYLTHNNPRRYLSAGMNIFYWSASAMAVWVFSLAISSLPWSGWNSWANHDARCHLSTLWPLSFTAFLTFIIGVHLASAMFMWASSRKDDLKTAAINSQNEAEGAPIAPTMRSSLTSGRIVILGFLLSAFTVLPLLFHVLLSSSCAASSTCMSSPKHYHEDAAGLPWTSLLLTAAGVVKPLLYVFSDDQVSTITLMLLSRICCCWKTKKQNQMVATGKESIQEQETNVYISNDTDNLVGD